MSELKPLPCPFCGGAPQSVERPDNIDGTRFFYALACYCGGYSACAHKMAVEPTPEQAKSAAIEAWNRRAQPAQAGHFHQALTDPENQPNQYGVEFLMHGPKFAFKVGAQQFTLDYEPTEPGEFEFMRDMLIHAFTTFTPDVKTAQAGQVLTEKSDG